MELNFEFEVEAGGVDMCKSIERNNLKREATGAIEGMRIGGMTDNDIIIKTMEVYHVTEEYGLHC
ncbi:MAG: hypothetical protein IJ719_18705 [Clostridia bacterium]|nr:hypothetical protein [Clostridia bacterium]